MDYERGPERARDQITCDFLFMCAGYYNYAQGYRPEFPGAGEFKGRIVHPQNWPDDLDYAGKRVVVIGSGATAVTLVPAMAETAAHVTMLQRSPTYVVSRPAEDAFANRLRKWLPGQARLRHHPMAQRAVQHVFLQPGAASSPAQVKDRLIGMVREQLGPDYDVDTHFTPTLQPLGPAPVPGARRRPVRGDQARHGLGGHRPDRDLHRGGIQLKSGETLDGRRHRHRHRPDHAGAERVGDRRSTARRSISAKTFSYKGMMYTGVPNLASSFGYTNASWTLKCDLTCRICLPPAEPHGPAWLHRQCRPVNDDPALEPSPGSTSARAM